MTPPVLSSVGAACRVAGADELIGPFETSVRPQELPWGAGASFDTAGVTRQPLLLVRLLTDLEETAYVVTVTVDGVVVPAVTFEAWSEQGTQVLASVPATDAQGTAARATGTVAVVRHDGGGTAVLSPAEVQAVVAVDLVQGVLGRLTFALLSEKARLRRQVREIRAMRALLHARSNALDLHGADLGVPRLRDALSWDAVTRNVAATPVAGGEPDAEYRARLRIVRGVRLGTPTWIDDRANGPGADTDPGAGWLADVGCATRLQVDETRNPLLVAFRLVDPGRDAGRLELLDAARRVHLVWASGSDGDAVHAARTLPAAVAARIAAARAALTTLGLPAREPVAPAVAFALQRLASLQTRLGVQVFTQVLHGQHDDGGSRYELGLGVQLTAPAAGTVDSAVTAATALLDPGMVPVPRTDDPQATWLLRAAGMRTAMPLADGTVYASTLSSGGLVVDLAPGPGAAVPITASARIDGPGDSEHDGPLHGVIDALAVDGLTPVASVPDLLTGIQATAANPGVDAALASLDLPRTVSVDDVRARLGAVSSRDYTVVDLGPATTAQVVADHAVLAAIVRHGARGGASSVLPLLTSGGTVALVFGLVDLPLAGNNLSSRHTVAYRWQVRGLVEHPVGLWPRLGPTTTLEPAGSGISVLTCLAYVRTGGNDPYQWRPTLPDDALLSLRQYEHLMNIVELVTPIGVRADTWDIRRRHVDVDGSGSATPLRPSAARTYHRYRPLHP